MYPFAGLVNEVPSTTPRLLINKQSVGAWSLLDDRDASEEEKRSNYRDVQVLGTCDEGVWHLVRELGWEDDLSRLAQGSSSSSSSS